MYVYTPPNYDRNRKYPVLYLLGGSGELASTWNIDGRAGFIADNLIAEGKALPMIIAMPNNQVVHRSDPKHTELTFPALREGTAAAHHPARRQGLQHAAGPARPGTAGLSMGGRHAQLVGFKSLDLFASFGILSAGDPDSEARRSSSTIRRSIRRSTTCSSAGTHENLPTNRSVIFHRRAPRHARLLRRR